MVVHGIVYTNTERTEPGEGGTIHVLRPRHVKNGVGNIDFERDENIAWCGLLNSTDVKSRADFQLVPLDKADDDTNDYDLCGQCQYRNRQTTDETLVEF